ncbi:hypothetical protein MKX08_002578 [Trichoderma sp. CBMAI-0020]|nr:hypothetical protein MKX08_002578 [Trichoderma sp. CBMAI-0020]
MSPTALHPNHQKLIDRAREFIAEIEGQTPGDELEVRLNSEFGPGTPYYEDFSSLIRQGLANNEGWISKQGVDGANFRVCDLYPPSEDTKFFSIITVHLENNGYEHIAHVHPYGELNCVIPLDPSAEMRSSQGWQGAGWTSPAPGSHHAPSARGGGLMALTFLPAGRLVFKELDA